MTLSRMKNTISWNVFLASTWHVLFLLIVLSPHLSRHLLQRHPEKSGATRDPDVCSSLRPLLPTALNSGRSGTSGWSAIADEDASSGHPDWRIGKHQSLLWPNRFPSHGGSPACGAPRSQSGEWESREQRCLAQRGWIISSEGMERLEHCEDLKQHEKMFKKDSRNLFFTKRRWNMSS